MSVGFLGLGVMGGPMAGHLKSAGVLGAVYNRTFAKTTKWGQTYDSTSGVKLGKTPAEAAEGLKNIALCVGNDDDVRQCVTGPDGVLKTMESGGVIVDHTTASAGVAREMAEACASKGIGFVDAPVSGGEIGAIKGILTIMCGGKASDYDLAAEFMKHYGKTMNRMGESGSGQLCKMTNQILCAGNMAAAAEALAFADRVGLDKGQVIAAVTKGAGNSWYLENRGDTMIEGKYDFGFAIKLLLKDLGIVLNEANKNEFATPVTFLSEDLFQLAKAEGYAEEDVSALHKLCKSPKMAELLTGQKD